MKTILVVDDSRLMAEEVARQLQGSDFAVAAACRSAEEAVKQMQAQTPDAVLMDIVLPGIDGIQATRLLSEKWPDVPVVIMSSLAYDETVDAARDVGAKSFLFKPFTEKQLLEVLQAVTL